MLLYDYALSFVGVPYKWGGRSPKEGLDCSSLTRILLRSQGIEIDTCGSAQALHFQFSTQTDASSLAQLGSLIFYCGNTKDIDHVTMALDDKTQIEAAGGDHNTLTLQDAIDRAAFVRVTPIRTPNAGIYLPKYYWL